MLELFGEALGGHGVPGVGFIPEFVELLPLLWPLLPGVVELEVDPGVELEELLLFVPGNGPHGPLFGCVPLGIVVAGVLPGVVPGVVLLGVVVLCGIVLGVVLCVVEPGYEDPGVVLGVVVVPAGGVAVLPGGVAVPGVVVDPGVGDPGVVDPGVVLCPAVPVELLELPGDVPPAGAVCATAQPPQHNTAESRTNLFLDICIASELLVAGFQLDSPYSTNLFLQTRLSDTFRLENGRWN